MSHKFKSLSFSLLTVLALSGITGCAFGGNGNSSEGIPSDSSSNTSDVSSEDIIKDFYSFTYNYNYSGGRTQTVQVARNTRATNLKPTRSGYTFGGWYLDEECTQAFNFSTLINEDIVVYARWSQDGDKVSVTFDFNYTGSDKPAVLLFDKGNKISKTELPANPRLGYVYDKWYTDQACTTEWNFSTDVVGNPMTLYATYDLDSSIPRKGDGSIDYTGVTLNVFAAGAGFDLMSNVSTFASSFRSATGITVNVSTDLTNQDTYSLRVQQTPEMNRTYLAYYKAKDVMGLAGHEVNEDEYFSPLIEEAKVNGTLYSIPYGAAPNYIIYNKAKMSLYNGSNPLPTKLSEFKTLASAFTSAEPTKKGAVIQTEWPMRESLTMAPFVQNEIPYYSYNGEKYNTDWGTTSGNTKGLTALQEFYNWFGPNGNYKGGTNSEADDDDTVNAVQNGDALFGIIAHKKVSSLVSNSAIGVLPLTGFFSEKTTGGITNHPMGFSFYKAANVSLVQLAAAGEFVHYCITEKSSNMMSNGYVPAYKAGYNGASLSSSVQYLKTIVPNGEYLANLPGHVGEKDLFNSQLGTQLYQNVLSEENASALSDYIEVFVDQIQSTLGY